MGNFLDLGNTRIFPLLQFGNRVKHSAMHRSDAHHCHKGLLKHLHHLYLLRIIDPNLYPDNERLIYVIH